MSIGRCLNNEDDLYVRMASQSHCEGQRKKKRLQWTWKEQVEVESMKIGLSREDGGGGKRESWLEQGRW